MEYVAATIGISLPVMSAKQIVMIPTPWQVYPSCIAESQRAGDSCLLKDHKEGCPPIPPSIVIDNSKSALAIAPVSPLRSKPSRKSLGFWFHSSSTSTSSRSQDADDEATLETCNSSQDETSFSSSSSSAVSFAAPLVTQVHYRPMVETLEEKRALFYCEVDYLAFRQDYLRKRHAAKQRKQRTGPRVQFAQDVVTQVHCYPNPCLQDNGTPKNVLFYSEQDLQRFLDDFVASLNGAALPQSQG